jgi:hypothetical protein
MRETGWVGISKSSLGTPPSDLKISHKTCSPKILPPSSSATALTHGLLEHTYPNHSSHVHGIKDKNLMIISIEKAFGKPNIL